MVEDKKRFVMNGITYKTKPGTDWSFVYYDHDDDVHSSMAIFGQTTITNALFETECSRTSSELFGLEPAAWQYKALYQDGITEHVRKSLRTTIQRNGHLVWYLVLGTGDIFETYTESMDFVTVHMSANYPEIPEGGTVDDYIEILGIARTDTDPELIV
jgi:hypothetical protein